MKNIFSFLKNKIEKTITDIDDVLKYYSAEEPEYEEKHIESYMYYPLTYLADNLSQNTKKTRKY